MGRAATNLKICSKDRRKENAAQFSIFLPSGYKHDTTGILDANISDKDAGTRYHKKITAEKKECYAFYIFLCIFLYIYFYLHASLDGNGDNGTPVRVGENKKWEEQQPL